ncbi:ankyrin repeat-containing domain protein [Aspergillus spinulosporus]
MAEALGLVVNIAAVIQVAAEVAQLSYKYARDVKNAPRTQKEYLQEVSALMEVLFRVEQAVQDVETTGLLPARPSSLSADTVMDCYKALSGLYFDLQKRRSRFLQPLHEREWRAHIDMLTKYRSLFVDFLSSCILTTGTATYNKVSLIKEEQDRSLLLTWLPAPNASARRRPSPCPGTGSWFLGQDSVRQWLEGSKSFLWCYGAPGVGKSFLASRVIDHLLETRTPPDHPVLYFFCDFSSHNEQRVIDILHHLLRQVIEQSSAEVLNLLKESCKDPGRLQQAAEVTQLIATAGLARPMYLVLDAVDELREPTSLLSHITNLVSSGINVLIMSRDVPHIRKKMTLATHFEVDSNPSDLKVYIESRFRDSDFSDEVEEDERMIGDVASSSGNLFLLTRLLLDDILDMASINQIRKALRKPHANVHQAFQATMDRIESQSKGRSSLARRLLCWVSYAKRRLKLQEILCAFSVEEGEEFDSDNKPNPDVLLRACHGLVVVDTVDNTVGLVHTTAYEFFRNGNVLGQEGDYDIARTSLQYLNMSNISPCTTSAELLKWLESLEFLDYAARYWGQHIRGPDEECQLEGLITKLLRNRETRNGAFQVLQYRQEFSDASLGEEMLQSIPTDLGTLHIAAYWGLAHTTEMLLADGASVYEVDTHNWTALHWACSRSHAGVARILVENGADVNARDIQGWTPLFWAAYKGDDQIISLLLDNGANHLSRSMHGWTALHWAVSSGHPEAVKILLEHHARSRANDTEFLRMRIEDVVAYAESVLPVKVAGDGQDEEIFNLLAQHLQTPKGIVGDAQFNEIWANAGFDQPASGNPWRTMTKGEEYNGLESRLPSFTGPYADDSEPYREDVTEWKTALLTSAIRDGQLSSARILARTGADVESALFAASCRSDPDYVRCLLENGADPNRPSYGKIPLHEAVLNGFLETTEALIDGGADVNHRVPPPQEPHRTRKKRGPATTHVGATPLIQACGFLFRSNPELSLQMARLLISRGAVADAKDDSGMTALHYAVMEPYPPLIELLVNSGCPVDARDAKGRLPIHCLGNLMHSSSRRAHEAQENSTNLLEAARVLIHGGQDNDAVNMLNTPVRRGLSTMDDHTNRLSDEKVKLEGLTPLEIALGANRWEVVTTLYHLGARIPDGLDLGPKASAAIADFAADAVDLLLDNGAQVSPDAVHSLLGALRYRLSEGKRVNEDLSQFKHILGRIIPAGADVNFQSEHGDTALTVAARAAVPVDVLKNLVDMGADVFSVSGTSFDPVLTAVVDGDTKCLNYLLHVAATHPRKDHWTERLGEVGEISDPITRVCICLEKVGALDRVNDKGRTILHLAAEKGNVPLITNLLAHGARLDIVDADGRYAIQYTGANLKTDALQALLPMKTAVSGILKTIPFWLNLLSEPVEDPNGYGQRQNIFGMAVVHGNFQMTQLLLEYGMDPNTRLSGWRHDGKPLLYYAAEKGQSDLVELLLTQGASVDLTDSYGWTPLHAACYFGHLDTTKILIEAGSDVHAETSQWNNDSVKPTGLYRKDAYKAQPLHLATMAGNSDIVKLLLSKGVDAHAQTKHGEERCSSGHGPTALHLALDTGEFYCRRGLTLDANRLQIAQWMVDRGLKVQRVVSKWGLREILKFKDFPDLWDALRAEEIKAREKSGDEDI